VTFQENELDFDTPRHSTARIIIFCIVCQKNGTVSYPTDDNGRRAGGGRYRGPTMPLRDFIDGKPHVCARCQKRGTMSEIQRDLFGGRKGEYPIAGAEYDTCHSCLAAIAWIVTANFSDCPDAKEWSKR